MSKVSLDNRRLRQIIRDQPNNTETFLKSVAFSIEREAKILAPVDTGALKNSIIVSDRNTQPTPAEKDYELPRGNRTKVFVGPTMEYAIFQEFGTSRSSAQPYLIPALERVANQLSNHTRLIIP